MKIRLFKLENFVLKISRRSATEEGNGKTSFEYLVENRNEIRDEIKRYHVVPIS